ncbi:MAG: phage tail tube protein [Alteraurantiacibacter sp.]
MINWKSKTLLAKIEDTYGEDAAPTGAANAILALNVRLAPMEGQDTKRETEKVKFGADPSIPTGLYSTLTFDVELVGSGATGTAPAWGPLLRMLGIAEVIDPGVSVEYSPITDNPESGSIYFAVGQTRHVLLGARGTGMLKVDAQGIPMLSVTMTGLFTIPTKVPAIVPDLTAFQKPQVASKANTPTFTIGGLDFVMRSFELDLANDVQTRLLVNQEAVRIVDKAESVRTRVEAVELDVYNPFAIAQAQTEQAIQLIHGTEAGKRVQIDIPAAQQMRLSGYENEQNVLEWPLGFTPLPQAGDDQWLLTLN